MKYYVEKGEFQGAICFKVLDENGKLMAMPDTLERAEKEAHRLSGLPDIVPNKTNFEYQSAMYGSDGSYSQGPSNSEADEDRSFGL